MKKLFSGTVEEPRLRLWIVGAFKRTENRRRHEFEMRAPGLGAIADFKAIFSHGELRHLVLGNNLDMKENFVNFDRAIATLCKRGEVVRDADGYRLKELEIGLASVSGEAIDKTCVVAA